MNRLIIENVEGRITLGIVMFVAIMILIGWVAINEPARMASFTEQQTGRAIERGAELYTANCSSCHGVNGYGSGLAPALNSPHFFGYDFMADVNSEIVRYQREEDDLQKVIAELTLRREELIPTLGALAADDATGRDLVVEIADIDARLQDSPESVLVRWAALGAIVLPERREDLLDEEATLATLIEIGNIDAMLLDDEAAVAERIAAIEAGEPLDGDALAGDTELTEAQLAERLAALKKNIPNILRAAGIPMGELALEERINESNAAYAALSADELEARYVALDTNIPNRLREINLALNGDGTADNAGLLAEREAIMASLTGAELRGYMPRLTEWNQALEAGTLSPLEYTNNLTNEANRLSQVGWGGTLEGYILTTLIHGRPGSNVVWNNAGMVSWSQRGGGPLRDDQLRDLIAYILNWDKGDNWTLTDLNAVSQFAKLHDVYTLEAEGTQEAVSTDPNQIGPEECAANPDCVIGIGTVREIAEQLPAGDSANGALLYAGSNGCATCHVGGVIGPDIAGTLGRVEAERLTLEEFAGWTPDDYLVHSILYPNHFVVPSYQPAMTATFGQTLTLQDLADLIAYIKEQ
jgi:mono/diheme cytochrome c family protein